MFISMVTANARIPTMKVPTRRPVATSDESAMVVVVIWRVGRLRSLRSENKKINKKKHQQQQQHAAHA